MTIDERFKQEQLETLRRLRDETAQAMSMIESDMLPLNVDHAGRRFMKCRSADFLIGDFEVHDRRKAAIDQLERDDNEILRR